jgi:hypothetical protein
MNTTTQTRHELTPEELAHVLDEAQSARCSDRSAGPHKETDPR